MQVHPPVHVPPARDTHELNGPIYMPAPPPQLSVPLYSFNDGTVLLNYYQCPANGFGEPFIQVVLEPQQISIRVCTFGLQAAFSLQGAGSRDAGLELYMSGPPNSNVPLTPRGSTRAALQVFTPRTHFPPRLITQGQDSVMLVLFAM